jgi:predicted DNA-binding transcriptional regulator AlpA
MNETVVYRISAVMKQLSISRATIYRMVSRGDLKLVKISKRASGITADSIQALLQRAA